MESCCSKLSLSACWFLVLFFRTLLLLIILSVTGLQGKVWAQCSIQHAVMGTAAFFLLHFVKSLCYRPEFHWALITWIYLQNCSTSFFHLLKLIRYTTDPCSDRHSSNLCHLWIRSRFFFNSTTQTHMCKIGKKWDLTCFWSLYLTAM